MMRPAIPDLRWSGRLAACAMLVVGASCAHGEKESTIPVTSNYNEVWPSALIVHDSALSGMKLVSGTYLLDGRPIYDTPNGAGSIGEEGETVVFRGFVLPGPHTLSVFLEYQPDSKLFSYTKGYKYRVSSVREFVAENGKETKVAVVLEKPKTFATRPEDALAIRFETE